MKVIISINHSDGFKLYNMSGILNGNVVGNGRFIVGPDIVTNGLVLYLDAANKLSYPGTGTSWFDITGNGNDGTLTNGPTFNSSNAGSIVFDGTNDYVLINNPTNFANQNFTISTWINPGTQNTNLIAMIDFEHANVTVQNWVIQSEDAITNRYYYLAWHDGSSFQPVGNFGVGKGIQITTSSWQNITYTKNGTSLLGYLNGVQVFNATGTNANVNYGNNKNFSIGGLVQSLRHFKGNVSNTTLYNRALSASEVLQNYNAIKGRYGG